MAKSTTTLTGEVTPLAAQSMRQPMPSVYVEEPVTIIIFGASGDLTLRKLVPGLYALYAQGLFRERFAIVGYARRSYDDSSFRERMREAVKSFSRFPVEDARLDEFISRLYYHKGELEDIESFRALKVRLQDEARYPANRVFLPGDHARIFFAGDSKSPTGLNSLPPRTPNLGREL